MSSLLSSVRPRGRIRSANTSSVCLSHTSFIDVYDHTIMVGASTSQSHTPMMFFSLMSAPLAIARARRTTCTTRANQHCSAHKVCDHARMNTRAPFSSTHCSHTHNSHTTTWHLPALHLRHENTNTRTPHTRKQTTKRQNNQQRQQQTTEITHRTLHANKYKTTQHTASHDVDVDKVNDDATLNPSCRANATA
jgi:hypothetical protein